MLTYIKKIDVTIYSFDGVDNVEIHNAKLLSKDAFWNSKNVTLYDSYISGEYLGWNVESKLANPQTSMLILCNPHNPVGKIWDKETLEKIG